MLFLHMPKGADKLCKYIAGSGLCSFAILIENFPALIEKSPKILKRELEIVFLKRYTPNH